jgi:hypothetical protein
MNDLSDYERPSVFARILRSGFHWPMMAVACLMLSLPPIGTPTVLDAWTTAVSFPLGAYFSIRAVRADNFLSNICGVLLVASYVCIVLFLLPKVLDQIPDMLKFWFGE